MKKLWMCGPYILKLIKKNYKTIATLLFFMFIIKVSNMSNYKKWTRSIISLDKPRYFLKGKQPYEKISFCEFNYGLPDDLNWDTINVATPPELGEDSPHRVIYNAINGTAYAGVRNHTLVTYVTHATPEYIYHIVEIARHWEGPISLAIFVPAYDLEISMQILKHLCSCYVGMSKVSVHLYFPESIPPTRLIKENVANVSSYIKSKVKHKKHVEKHNNMPFTLNGSMTKFVFKDCYYVESIPITTYRMRHKYSYPVNVGRNVARNASLTNYFLMSDIEMIPSKGLASGFVTLVRTIMGNKLWDAGYVFPLTIFVVPIFEVVKGGEIPRDKKTLVNMIKDSKANLYNVPLCKHCQMFPGYYSWLKNRSCERGLTTFSANRRIYPYHRWEPLYFGTNEDPWFHEIFCWEGLQDKMTQMLEFCLLNYTLVVLDGGFLVHAGSQRRQRHKRAERMNRRSYKEVVERLKSIYSDYPPCRLYYGLRGVL